MSAVGVVDQIMAEGHQFWGYTQNEGTATSSGAIGVRLSRSVAWRRSERVA